MSDLGFSGAPSLDFARDLLGQDFNRPWSMLDWRGEFRAGALQNNLPFVQSGLLTASRSAFGAGTSQLANVFGNNPLSNLNSAHPQSVIQSGGLTINITFDTSVGSAPAGFTTAVNAAVAYLESQFSDPITINIHVGWGEVAEGLGGPSDPGTPISSGALGQSLTNLFGFTYTALRDKLLADAKSADDNTANATLGTTDPTSGGTFLVSVAEARALALHAASDSLVDGYVGFDSTAAFDFNNSDGVAAGHYDFYDVVLHEFTEVMGRQMANGGSNQYEALDLFHYSAPGTPIFAAATTGYFSINGGTTNLNNFNTDPGGDSGDWAASAGNDSFLAFSGPGVVNAVSTNDIREMDILGYDRVASGGTPDLTVNTVSFANTTFSYHVNNVGTGAAGASSAGVYLSADSTITTGDTRINVYATPSLAASAVDNESVVLALPTNLTPGTYYIGAIADYLGAVAESSEANNASVGTAIILGNDNANTLTATAAADRIIALAGNDSIVMAANLTAADQVDGGAGTDVVTLNGNYAAGVTFSATTMVNVETINPAAGHSYKLVTNDATIAAGQTLTINGSALGAADVLTVTGSAETNGNFIMYGGAGNDVLTGGAGNDSIYLTKGGNDIAKGGGGNDVFYMNATFTASDQIDGGGGGVGDSVYLTGNYAAGLTLGATTMINVEALYMTAGFNYNITTNDATVAAGLSLTANASGLTAGNSLVFNGAAETNGKFVITGGAGNDTVTGGAGNDTFNLMLAGNDIANGGGGNDTFSMNGAFTASDQIDGGLGAADTVNLKGNYSALLTLGATTMVNVETLTMNAGFNYNIATNDANVASGQTLTVNAGLLLAPNTLIFNGGSELDGKFAITGGAGNDTLTGGASTDTFNLMKGGNDIANGGAGNDTFNMNATLTASDRIDGGTGTDNINLNGNYSAGLVLGATTMVNVESFFMAAGFSYNITSNNANVAAGQTFTVNGVSLGVSDTLTFNGSAETDGKFIFKGGLGGDHFTGGGGADTFVYSAVSQSTSVHYDTVGNFNFSADKFDVTAGVTVIDGPLNMGALNTASFDSDLAAATSALVGHHAELFTPDSGTLSGQTFLVVDINGASGYQAGADLVIHLTAQTGTLATTDFI